ncbi:MAG TPA: hypothetical protein VNY73_00780 [Bacteroidia bacterium]|nr:hypothetical protein [Bacteroidia bacterium]
MIREKKFRITSSLVVCFLLLHAFLCAADEPAPKKIGRNNYELIRINLQDGIINSFKPLPFDVPFVFWGKTDSCINSITVYYKEAGDPKFKKEKNDTIYTCNCEDNTKDSRKLCPWKRIKTFVQDTFYITIPPLRANTKYQFIFKISRKHSLDEVLKINLDTKKYLLNEIRYNFSSIYNPATGTIKENLINRYKNHLKGLLQNIYIRTDTIKIKKGTKILKGTKVLKGSVLASAPNAPLAAEKTIDNDEEAAADCIILKPVYLYTENPAFFSLDKTLISNVDWSFLANQVDKLNTDLSQCIDKEHNAEVFFDTLKRLLLKPRIIVPHREWLIHELNGLIQETNILAAIKGKYNLDSGTEDGIKDLSTDLDSTTIATKLVNQKILLDKLKAEYIGLDTVNNKDKINGADWPAAAAAFKEFYASFLACYNLTGHIKDNYKKMFDKINVLSAEDYLTDIQVTVPLGGGSTLADFITRAEYYITGDLGVAYVDFDYGYKTPQHWNEVLPYAGVNFNLFPINRQAQYKYRKYKDICKYPWWYIFSKKISAVMGVSYGSVEKTVGSVTYRTGLIGTNSKFGILGGAGFRLGDFGRITAGVMFSKYRDQNLLLESYHIKASPFISLSLDLDVKSYVKNLTDVFFPGNSY